MEESKAPRRLILRKSDWQKEREANQVFNFTDADLDRAMFTKNNYIGRRVNYYCYLDLSPEIQINSDSEFDSVENGATILPFILLFIIAIAIWNLLR